MPRDKVDVVRQANDAYNRRDINGSFAEFATPDLEWFPALSMALEGGGYRGREDVEKFAADTRENWEELQALPEEFRELGDRSSCWVGCRDVEKAAALKSVRR
jgi:ketosteroid isomerase-like protein